jgi:hypothetical protein
VAIWLVYCSLWHVGYVVLNTTEHHCGMTTHSACKVLRASSLLMSEPPASDDPARLLQAEAGRLLCQSTAAGGLPQTVPWSASALVCHYCDIAWRRHIQPARSCVQWAKTASSLRASQSGQLPCPALPSRHLDLHACHAARHARDAQPSAATVAGAAPGA